MTAIHKTVWKEKTEDTVLRVFCFCSSCLTRTDGGCASVGTSHRMPAKEQSVSMRLPLLRQRGHSVRPRAERRQSATVRWTAADKRSSRPLCMLPPSGGHRLAIRERTKRKNREITARTEIGSRPHGAARSS